MKKIYSLIFASVFALAANATTWTVNVTNNSFTPQTIPNVEIGDVITWHLVTGVHTTTSGSVPGGALPWDSGTLTVDFNYNVTTAGSYGYICSYHFGSGMVGGFSVIDPTGITEPTINLLTSNYPNPFNDKIIIQYNKIESLDVYNVIGEKVKALELSAAENKTEIDLSNFPSGIYFYRTYKEGTLIETRKIIKAN